MTDKIVVCCRFSHEGIRGANATQYLPRARALTQRAEALGATLCAWSALTMAFAWDPDGIEEAIDLATTLTGTAAGDPGPGESPTPWACGIAQGEVEQLATTGARAELAWGMPLVVALALSRIAKYGEVLVHGSLAAIANGTLNTLDVRSDTDVGFEARGLRLDRKNPWKQRRRVSTTNLDAVRPPPPPPPPVVVAPPPPRVAQVQAPQTTARAEAPSGASASPPPPATSVVAHGTVAKPPLAAAPTSTKVPVSAASPAAGSSSAARPPMRAAAMSFPAIPATRYSTPSSIDTEEVDPEALAARMMQLSKDALLGGDANALEKWSEGLKATGEKDSFAERMRAITRLSRGRVGDALQALSRARKNAEAAPPAKRCQASLALAVGYAFAGRTDDALLEGLDALARAREGNDERAARACLAFLAKLYTSVGRNDDAAHVSVAAASLDVVLPSL